MTPDSGLPTPDSRNLVLIGYRGTGKSTIAKLLGERLGREVVSLDAEIVKSAGKPIPEIVAELGWERFRDLETIEVERHAKRSRLVLDCGGGAVLRERNVRALKAGGMIFLLTAQVETIVARISGDANRPTLTGKGLTEEVAEVLRQREEYYLAAADHIIPTDDADPTAIAGRIAGLFLN